MNKFLWDWLEQMVPCPWMFNMNSTNMVFLNRTSLWARLYVNLLVSLFVVWFVGLSMFPKRVGSSTIGALFPWLINMINVFLIPWLNVSNMVFLFSLPDCLIKMFLFLFNCLTWARCSTFLGCLTWGSCSSFLGCMFNMSKVLIFPWWHLNMQLILSHFSCRKI